jgi:hypothetical protein
LIIVRVYPLIGCTVFNVAGTWGMERTDRGGDGGGEGGEKDGTDDFEELLDCSIAAST